MIFVLAIAVNSRISAAFAALGSALGLLTALALGGNGVLVYHGLYGFNPVLCAIALGGLFFVLTRKSAAYALGAVVFSAIVFAGRVVLLSPIGMPALTAPFVLVTWLFLLPKAGFEPRGGYPTHRASGATAWTRYRSTLSNTIQRTVLFAVTGRAPTPCQALAS